MEGMHLESARTAVSQRAMHMQHALLRLLPQTRCRYCGQSTGTHGLCQSCDALLTDSQQRCFRCALPLPDSSVNTVTCGSCLSKPPPFHRSLTAFDYRSPIDAWLNNFKHHRDLRDGHLLTLKLALAVRRAYHADHLPQLLVAVPLHWRRQLWRSFNQSAWICHCLGKDLRIAVIQPLQRIGGGHSQQSLQRRDRRRNPRLVYRLHPRRQLQVRGYHVALVDDVVTTGATATALTELLLAAGATRVDVWSLARTPSIARDR